MYSDEEDEAPETGSNEGHDKKLEELWAKKQRRRSSDLKIFQGDRLGLKDSSKMVVLLAKNCEKVCIIPHSYMHVNNCLACHTSCKMGCLASDTCMQIACCTCI